jgi:hypothetical protein
MFFFFFSLNSLPTQLAYIELLVTLIRHIEDSAHYLLQARTPFQFVLSNTESSPGQITNCAINSAGLTRVGLRVGSQRPPPCLRGAAIDHDNASNLTF